MKCLLIIMLLFTLPYAKAYARSPEQAFEIFNNWDRETLPSVIAEESNWGNTVKSQINSMSDNLWHRVTNSRKLESYKFNRILTTNDIVIAKIEYTEDNNDTTLSEFYSFSKSENGNWFILSQLLEGSVILPILLTKNIDPSSFITESNFTINGDKSSKYSAIATIGDDNSILIDFYPLHFTKNEIEILKGIDVNADNPNDFDPSRAPVYAIIDIDNEFNVKNFTVGFHDYPEDGAVRAISQAFDDLNYFEYDGKKIKIKSKGNLDALEWDINLDTSVYKRGLKQQ